MPTHYEQLGVSQDATPAEIKNAFRLLARKFHPDKNRGLSSDALRLKEATFVVIQEAYSVLSDPEMKNRYDRKIGKGFTSSSTSSTTSFRAYKLRNNPFSSYGKESAKPNVPKPKTFYSEFLRSMDSQYTYSSFGNPYVHSFGSYGDGPRAQRQKMQGPFRGYPREEKKNSEEKESCPEKESPKKESPKKETPEKSSEKGSSGESSEKVQSEPESSSKPNIFTNTKTEEPRKRKNNEPATPSSPLKKYSFGATHFLYKKEAVEPEEEVSNNETDAKKPVPPEVLASLDSMLKERPLKPKVNVFKTQRRKQGYKMTDDQRGVSEDESEEELVEVESSSKPEKRQRTEVYDMPEISNIPPFTQNKPENYDFLKIGSAIGLEPGASGPVTLEDDSFSDKTGTNILSTPVNGTLPRTRIAHTGRVLAPEELLVPNESILRHKPRPPEPLKELNRNAWYTYKRDVERYQIEWLRFCGEVHLSQSRRLTAVASSTQDIFGQFANAQVYHDGIRADLELQKYTAMAYEENMRVMEEYYRNVLKMNGV